MSLQNLTLGKHPEVESAHVVCSCEILESNCCIRPLLDYNNINSTDSKYIDDGYDTRKYKGSVDSGGITFIAIFIKKSPGEGVKGVGIWTS
jgi:hypothetical protein